jgi:hypothetical protein
MRHPGVYGETFSKQYSEIRPEYQYMVQMGNISKFILQQMLWPVVFSVKKNSFYQVIRLCETTVFFHNL